MTEPVTAAHLALAGALADKAGGIIRHYFRQPLTVEQKADNSPVTIADREAEAEMRALIETRFPDHGIIGEEHGRTRPDADYVWVLDPIDGTKSFISGIPLFGTLIALTLKGRPVLGIIEQPVLRERWIGAEGRATTLNGKPAKTRTCSTLAAATLYATSPDLFQGAEATAFERLRKAVKLARYGADCYAYGQVASGLIDLVVEASLKPYDFCAMAPVIEGAGGEVSDWQGEALTLQSAGQVVASGDPALAQAARAALAGK